MYYDLDRGIIFGGSRPPDWVPVEGGPAGLNKYSIYLKNSVPWPISWIGWVFL